MAEEIPEGKGMNFLTTTLFLIAQMAGVGFLALPNAVADTGEHTYIIKLNPISCLEGRIGPLWFFIV